MITVHDKASHADSTTQRLLLAQRLLLVHRLLLVQHLLLAQRIANESFIKQTKERNNTMIFSTTPTLEGHPIREYRGVVTGETIIGANVFKDFMAGLRDFFGGRSGTYESVLREAKDSAMREMAQRAESLGCNAIVGIDLDYETVGQGGSMLMVTCSGTAVII